MLISKEEEARLERLQALHAGDEDLQWTLNLVRRLAAVKPTEENFLQYVGLVNTVNRIVFGMKFVERLTIAEQAFSWESRLVPGRVRSFSLVLQCDLSDAILLARPYVRVVMPSDPQLLEMIGRLGSVRVTVGEDLVWQGPLGDVLLDQDGYGLLRRQPFTLPAPVDVAPYQVARILPDNRCEIAPGLFASNQSEVAVFLTLPAIQKAGNISTGLVAARYTSKGSPYAFGLKYPE